MDQELAFAAHEKPFRYDEDGLHVTRGSAWSGPGCHLGCGVLMYVDDDGKLVKVEGDPENPYNQGRLCARCLATPNAVNSPLRIRKPMIRDGKRGEDKWKEISWDEAFDLVEEKFNYYKENYGAESVTFWEGTGRDISAWISRLAWSFGSPNMGPSLNGLACYGPRVYGCFVLSGSFWVGDYSQQFVDRYDNPEWKCPEVIMVWGNNPIVANSDGALGHWVVDCMQRGSKLIVVDPKITWLASRADVVIQLRPGTDAALAMAMANVMIEEGLYDREFVDYWVYGFEEYAQAVSEFTPEKAAEICWVEPEVIRQAARMYAAADGGLIQWGVALDQKEEAIPTCQAVAALMMLTGNVDNPGGMIKPPELLMYLNGWGMELLSQEQWAKRLGVEKYSFYASGGVTVASAEVMVEAMETGEPYPLKAAWIQTTNLLTCMGVDPDRTKRAFENLEFIVMVDPFKNPTMIALADLVLPACMYPERNGIRCGDGCQRAETINRAIDPGDTKSDMEINLELGRRFNPEAWPWETVEEMFSSILEETGMTFEEAQQNAPGYLPYEYYKYKKGMLRPDGQLGFNTPTGRLELYSNIMANMGLDPLPTFVEPTPGPVTTPELYEEFPLVLTTGARRWNTFHAENRENPRLRRIHPEPTVQVHPDTAAELGLCEGEWVWLEGPKGMSGEVGRCKRVVEITPAIRPDVVSTDHAWWHPEGDPEKLYDMPELNVNKLMAWGAGPSGIGANYKSLLCRIRKMTEE
ncbi:MAG: molybdopterin-dependent oxidoreductase [Eggerthellales bacterium]|nr:molybdopterin-dependent oxidoreductase [Eggerthellales bacterium]